jgi:hypothetical protein
LRGIGVAFTGMAVALGIMAIGIAEPAAAKAPKDCGDGRPHQANRTEECRDIIIENFDRGSSNTSKFYRSNPHKAKKYKSQTKTN